MKKLYAVKSKNSNFTYPCCFNKVGNAMKFATDVMDFKPNEYEIVEFAQCD